MRPFRAGLRDQARGFGFVHVIGHGIEPAVTTELLGWSRRFFALPDAENNAIAMLNWNRLQGQHQWPRRRLTSGPRSHQAALAVMPTASASRTGDLLPRGGQRADRSRPVQPGKPPAW